MSTLQVTLNQGNLKKSSELIGSMENFVYLKLVANGQEREFRSRIVDGDVKKPIQWNQTINIPIPPNGRENAKLFVEIRDKDVGTSDDVCGQGFINLDHCGMFAPGRKNYSIRLHDIKDIQMAGDLSFSTNLV